MTSKCCNEYIVTDYTSGDCICTECGLVVESHLMDTHDSVEEQSDISQLFENALLKYNCPSTSLKECLNMYAKIGDKNCVNAIVLHVNKLTDPNVSKNKCRRVEEFSQQKLKSSNVSLLKHMGYSHGLLYKDIDNLLNHINDFNVFNRINRKPTIIICALLHLVHHIPIPQLSESHSVSIFSIRKTVFDLKALLKE